MISRLEDWQMVLAVVLYTAYLCWVMFGGMKKKRIKPKLYAAMTLLMLYGLAKEFDGIDSAAAVIDIGIVLLVGFIKGIYLGRRKLVEKIDGTWYMRHNGRYIVAWVLFFAVKIACTAAVKAISGAQMPLWHMILYFCFYYPWRTANVFIANPEMRREVLTKH